MENVPDNLINWLANGERGVSSETIVQTVTGISCCRYLTSHPLDPSDLMRCKKLLDQCPFLRDKLHLMSAVSPQWAKLVESWDSLVALMMSEFAETRGRSAPKTYQKMKEMGC